MTYDVCAAIAHFGLLCYITSVVCVKARNQDRRCPPNNQIMALRAAYAISLVLLLAALVADIATGEAPLLLVKGMWNFAFIAVCFTSAIGVYILEGKGKRHDARRSERSVGGVQNEHGFGVWGSGGISPGRRSQRSGILQTALFFVCLCGGYGWGVRDRIPPAGEDAGEGGLSDDTRHARVSEFRGHPGADARRTSADKNAIRF